MEQFNNGTYYLSDLGIKSGEKHVTQELNKAIARISESGGGELVFGAGTYFIGTVILKSNITLRLIAGTRLRSTGKREDYIEDNATGGSIFEGENNMGSALIFGENLENVSLVGEGVIDGNGIAITAGDKACLYPEGKNHYAEDNYEFVDTWRPFTLKLNNCKNVTLQGVRFVNPASWNVGMNECKDVFVRGIDIKSRNFYNGDGLDFNACERVYISDSTFDCTDDCIALQSAHPGKSCKNIFIKGCYFTSLLAGIRIGMACLGDFENITVSDCTFENCRCSGLKVQECEGGKIENLIFRGLIMKNVAKPIFFTHNTYACTKFALRNEDTDIAKRGTLGHVLVSDCIIRNEISFDCGGIIFDAEDGFEISDVTINNLIYEYVGADTKGDISQIPQLTGHRPESDVYGGHNIWGGMFLRNCRNFVFKNLSVCDGVKTPRFASLINCDSVSFEFIKSDSSNVKIVQKNCKNIKES